MIIHLTEQLQLQQLFRLDVELSACFYPPIAWPSVAVHCPRLGFKFRVPPPTSVSIATLLYFRPAIIGMVVDHGAGGTPEALAEEAHPWVALNWVRFVAVAASLAMGVQALLPLR